MPQVYTGAGTCCLLSSTQVLSPSARKVYGMVSAIPVIHLVWEGLKVTFESFEATFSRRRAAVILSMGLPRCSCSASWLAFLLKLALPKLSPESGPLMLPATKAEEACKQEG